MSFYSDNRGGFMSNVPTAVKHILIINVLIMLMVWMDQTMMFEKFALFFPLSPYFEWWQPFTYMFLHADLFHLFFNMYALYIFGSVLERYWGTRKFVIFYLVTGLGAGLVHMGVQWYEYQEVMKQAGYTLSDIEHYFPQIKSTGVGPVVLKDVWQVLSTPTLGASGAIYGILMGFAMMFPNTVLTLIFPPVSLKAKWFVLIFAGLEMFIGVTGTQDGVAHFAHLGGLLFAFILIVYWRHKARRNNQWWQ